MLSQLQIITAVMQPVLSISFSATVSGYSTTEMSFTIRILLPLGLKCLMHSPTCMDGAVILLVSTAAAQLSGYAHVFNSISI